MPGRGKEVKYNKAAVLMVILGKDWAAKVMKYLPEQDAELLAIEIAKIKDIPKSVRQKVIEEFYTLLMAKEYIGKGGLEYAKEVLEKAYGPQKAEEIFKKLVGAMQVVPFEFLRKLDPQQVANLIQNEHPQTIALLLNYLTPQQATAVFLSLPPELAQEVAYRMAVIDRTSPEVIRTIEEELKRRFSAFSAGQDMTKVDGIATLVQILNSVDQQTQQAVLEYLDSINPALAEEVRKQMFVFEDIVLLDDRSIQRVLREVDARDLAIALKGASDAVKEKIFKNMSQRARQMLQEEMEYMGPVRVKQIEEAQQKIIAIIRRLEEAGEIVIIRGGEDVVM